jgi:hypothetical protein
MNGRKLPILCLLMTLACAIPLFTLLVVASGGQREAAIYGSFFMEFITPTLLFSLALTIHFLHKAHATQSFNSNGETNENRSNHR